MISFGACSIDPVPLKDVTVTEEGRTPLALHVTPIVSIVVTSSETTIWLSADRGASTGAPGTCMRGALRGVVWCGVEWLGMQSRVSSGDINSEFVAVDKPQDC